LPPLAPAPEDARRVLRKVPKLALAVVAILGLCGFGSRPTFPTRYVPLRWIELHADRHVECQDGGGTSFRAVLPTIEPHTWTSSEQAHWIVARMNAVYSGTGIQFWLKSHEVYCTDQIARFLRTGTGAGLPDQLTTPFLGSVVAPDLRLLFPNANLADLGLADSLRRERWLQKAVALFDDPRGMPILFHSDYEGDATTPRLPYQDGNGTNIDDFVLPQHGYAPWDSPGLAFMFLSAITWASDWRFDPELTLAHELGHALGNPHTLDFDIFSIGTGTFPDGSLYAWPDFWDLAYVRAGAAIKGFGSRRQAKKWVDANGTSQVHRIDDRWNVVLDTATGRMTARLDYDPALTVTSETLEPTVGLGSTRLLQGLSFDLAYFPTTAGAPPHSYAWQRNVMSYRYPDTFGATVDSSDPYDYLTARFSQSQIELMQRQLKGSTKFTVSDYGTIPAGKEAYFASRFNVLGDEKPDAFVWYSNGEGPDAVDTTDERPDMVAFRSIPADTPLSFVRPDKVRLTKGPISPDKLIAGDFNGDGLTDLVWQTRTAAARWRILWSRVQDGAHEWQSETLSDGAGAAEGYTPVAAGDFDGNGADDLLLAKRGATTQMIAYFDAGTRCVDYASCLAGTGRAELGALKGPVLTGDFDGVNGADVLWVEYGRGATYAHVALADGAGGLTYGGRQAVGSARYVPYVGNFNGTGGDDVLWYDRDGNEVIWWGAAAGREGARDVPCGPQGAWGCVDASADLVKKTAGFPLPGITIGDFDGNGAADIMIRDSHEPTILFSTKGTQLAYAGSYVPLKVALRNSWKYLTIVGDFDHATYGGNIVGDDILFFYGAKP
jgi:hypothetical protein